MYISIRQIGLISKIPGLAKHDWLNLQTMSVSLLTSSKAFSRMNCWEICSELLLQEKAVLSGRHEVRRLVRVPLCLPAEGGGLVTECVMQAGAGLPGEGQGLEEACSRTQPSQLHLRMLPALSTCCSVKACQLCWMTLCFSPGFSSTWLSWALILLYSFSLPKIWRLKGASSEARFSYQ